MDYRQRANKNCTIRTLLNQLREYKTRAIYVQPIRYDVKHKKKTFKLLDWRSSMCSVHCHMQNKEHRFGEKCLGLDR